jgi:hypothetical protein
VSHRGMAPVKDFGGLFLIWPAAGIAAEPCSFADLERSLFGLLGRPCGLLFFVAPAKLVRAGLLCVFGFVFGAACDGDFGGLVCCEAVLCGEFGWHL